MKLFLSRFLKHNKSDISPVEYVLIAALVSVAIMVGVRIVSGKLSGL